MPKLTQADYDKIIREIIEDALSKIQMLERLHHTSLNLRARVEYLEYRVGYLEAHADLPKIPD